MELDINNQIAIYKEPQDSDEIELVDAEEIFRDEYEFNGPRVTNLGTVDIDPTYFIIPESSSQKSNDNSEENSGSDGGNSEDGEGSEEGSGDGELTAQDLLNLYTQLSDYHPTYSGIINSDIDSMPQSPINYTIDVSEGEEGSDGNCEGDGFRPDSIVTYSVKYGGSTSIRVGKKYRW